jgi:ectoine hydrolase
MAWLTGYDGWSFYVHQGVIVFHDADPVWWGPLQDANGARAPSGWRTTTSPAMPTPTSSPPSATRWRISPRICCAMGYGGKRIGVELDNYYYSAKAHAVLAAELPHADAGGRDRARELAAAA